MEQTNTFMVLDARLGDLKAIRIFVENPKHLSEGSCGTLHYYFLLRTDHKVVRKGFLVLRLNSENME